MQKTTPLKRGFFVGICILFGRGNLVRLALTGCILLLSACALAPSLAERANNAENLATQANWQAADIKTDDFLLRTYLPKALVKAEALTIYIEGDGLAWFNASSPSDDPTPMNPLALKLALLDTSPAVYLARPCQYVGIQNQTNCSQALWTSHRFSNAVVSATNQAINQLKQKLNAHKLILVGYSGGGAVAALVAARRNDVVRLITVAGNLDHRAWTSEHHLTPLAGSLNPVDAWQQLQDIPQTHFVGSQDAVIGESVARSYAAHFISGKQPVIVVIPAFDHNCCWDMRWPTLKNAAF
jgi:alpha/beta hydrolase fold